MCEKSFSEDRLIKSHIKTNHPGKVMHLGAGDDFKNAYVCFKIQRCITALLNETKRGMKI